MYIFIQGNPGAKGDGPSTTQSQKGDGVKSAAYALQAMAVSEISAQSIDMF
jgi:hypothetical protein